MDILKKVLMGLGGLFLLLVLIGVATEIFGTNEAADKKLSEEEKGGSTPSPIATTAAPLPPPPPLASAPPPTQAAVAQPAPPPPGPPPHEIKVDTCKKEGIEVIASGTITNKGTDPHSFAVTVEFLDKSGARIEQGIDFVSSVPPGGAARWQQDNYTKEEYTLGECKVTAS